MLKFCRKFIRVLQKNSGSFDGLIILDYVITLREFSTSPGQENIKKLTESELKAMDF
jgi:hypothetical protein